MLQYALHATAYGRQPKVCGPHVLEREPHQRLRIVIGTQHIAFAQVAGKEKIGRVDRKAGVDVSVGEREKQAVDYGFSTRLFLYFAHYAVCHALAGVYETAGQVQRAARRVKGTTRHEQFAALVHYDCDRGGGGILIKSKAAGAATFGARVVNKELRTATMRTETEEVQRMLRGRDV